jgi:hypothetical protein
VQDQHSEDHNKEDHRHRAVDKVKRRFNARHTRAQFHFHNPAQHHAQERSALQAVEAFQNKAKDAKTRRNDTVRHRIAQAVDANKTQRQDQRPKTGWAF